MSLEEEEEEKELQFFKKMVKEYMKLDDEIKKLERACKVRREKKENIGDTILTYLKAKDISHINLQEQQLICAISKRTSGLSQQNISNSLHKYFKNNAQAKQAMDFILSDRTIKEVTSLKIKAISKKSKRNNSSLNHIETVNQEPIPEHLKYLYNDVTSNK